MSLTNSISILIACAVLFAAELSLYFKTGMPAALSSTGLPMVAAYKFLWLTIFTAAAGILAPVAGLVARWTQRRLFGLLAWGFLVGIAMLGFTVYSFLRAPSPAFIPEPPSPAAAGAAARKIGEAVQFVDSKFQQPEPEKIAVILRFRNNATRTITTIDYLFSLTDETSEVLLSIPIREKIYIPTGLAATSDLTWTRSAFTDPAPFDRMKEALEKGALRAVVIPQRAEFDDRSVAEG